jgi:hypothetical protein
VLPSVATLNIRFSMPAFLSLILREPPRMKSPAATVGAFRRRLTKTFKPLTSSSVTRFACSAMLGLFVWAKPADANVKKTNASKTNLPATDE